MTKILSRGTFLCLCLTVVQLVSLVLMIAVWFGMRSNMLASRVQKLCFTSKLTNATDAEAEKELALEINESFDEKKNETKYCGRPADLLTMLTKPIFSEKYASEKNFEFNTLRMFRSGCIPTEDKSNMIKLVGISTKREPVRTNIGYKLFWESAEEAMSKTGLHYVSDSGVVYVESSGVYEVDLQVKIQMNVTGETERLSGEIYKHFLQLNNSKVQEMTLLEDVKSMCDLASDTAEITSHTGAVFEFEEGDQLYVTTTHPAKIAKENNDNFLTLIRIN